MKIEDVKRMALAKGASVRIKGETFNSSRERMEPAPRTQAAPAPMPEPALPPAAPANSEVLAEVADVREILVDLARRVDAKASDGTQEARMEELLAKLSQKKARAWRIVPVRDKDDVILHIDCFPLENT